MRHHYTWIVLVILVLPLMLVACDGGDGSEDIVLPTRVQSGEDASLDEVTPIVPETGTTPEPEPTQAPSRSLPPSWTPTIAPTMTETPMPTPTRETVENVVPTIAPGCATFRLDNDNSVSEFRIGESPTVAWIEAGGAVRYRVRVTNETGFEITVDAPVVAETSITLNGELFTQAGRYGWTVEPLDVNGIQMCRGLGDLFIVTE